MKININKEKTIKAIKYIYCVLLLIILFLFALNGRYQVVGSSGVFDNWTKSLFHISLAV